MHLWCNRCRYCQLSLWASIIKDPASGDAVRILQQRVSALEATLNDGYDCAGEAGQLDVAPLLYLAFLFVFILLLIRFLGLV